MNLATIAWKSIRQRGLASLLTSFSVALGVMLMVTVLVIYGILQNTFNQRSINYHLIIGAKGSPLQLVLSTVYHVSPPIENLPYRYYLKWKEDKRVKHAIPLAMGDVTEQGNFPIVGTIPVQFFEIDYAPQLSNGGSKARHFTSPSTPISGRALPLKMAGRWAQSSSCVMAAPPGIMSMTKNSPWSD